MRFEKPHSLSYHEETFTSVPSDTRVRLESKIELAGLWLKSEDTSGSELYSRMPLRSVLHACLTALFTSSTYDETLTKVSGRLVKVSSWYDNEWGFSNRMLDTTVALMAAK